MSRLFVAAVVLLPLVKGVQDGLNAGRTLEQVQASNMLEKYKGWANFSQKNANIEEVYKVLRGRP